MQALIKEIVAGDLPAVSKRLEADASKADLVATAPPKKYAGQSALQIAYRTGQFQIAALLLAHGADPNYIDDDRSGPHSTPVLHDAVRAAVMRSRWLRPTRFAAGAEQWELRNSAEQTEAALDGLRRALEHGADIHGVDSSGNSALHRAVLDARQVLPSYRHSDPAWVDPKPLNPELVEDLTRVFDLLLARGADPGRDEPQLGASAADFYGAEPVAQFLPDPAGGGGE